MRRIYPQEYGAKGDGQCDDSLALQMAADAAAEVPESVLVIPEGDYLIENSIKFRSHVECHGRLLKSIEIDEERTTFSNFTFVPTHYPVSRTPITFCSDHEEIELDPSIFYGIQEGDKKFSYTKGIPLMDKTGSIEVSKGDTLRIHSSDFVSSRNNQKGDQYIDKNDIIQIVTEEGDLFPEFSFSYCRPPTAKEWCPFTGYKKGDYVSHNGFVFKATYTSGPGANFEDRYLGRSDIGPVEPQVGEVTTFSQLSFKNRSQDTLIIWRRVQMRVWYRKKDNPLVVDGLHIEVFLKNNDSTTKRIDDETLVVARSHLKFNNLKINVRDKEAAVAKLLCLEKATNIQINNGFFSGATHHGLGYNVLNNIVSNVQLNNCRSINCRKGVDGRYGNSVSIIGGEYDTIDEHFGRNYVIKNVIMNSRSTAIPGYSTPDADLQEWHFHTIQPFAFSGANIHIEDITVNNTNGFVFVVRRDSGILKGRVVIKEVSINNIKNKNIFLVSHYLDPFFDYGSDISTPDELVIENIRLLHSGQVKLNVGRGINPIAYQKALNSSKQSIRRRLLNSLYELFIRQL